MVIFFFRQVVSCFKSCHQAEDAHEWPFPGPDLYCTPALSNRLCVLRSVSRQSHQSIVSSTNRIDDISSLYKIMDRRERGGHLLQHDITLSCVLLFFFFSPPLVPPSLSSFSLSHRWPITLPNYIQWPHYEWWQGTERTWASEQL